MLETIRSITFKFGARQVPLADLTIVAVTSIFCLHLLRNLSPAYPVVAWAAAFIGMAIAGRWRRPDRVGLVLISAFLVALIYSVAISFLKVPQESYLLAIARFGFMAPYAAFVVLAVDTRERVRLALQSFAIWVAIAGITIILQNLYGPVSWFAPPSMRAEAVRYASLAGSLTIFGVVSVMALPIVYYQFSRMGWLRPVLLAIISAAMLMTLQKAAVVNVILFWGAVVVLAVAARFLAPATKRPRMIEAFQQTWFALVVFAMITAAVATAPRIDGGTNARSAVIATVDNVLRFDSEIQNDDVGFVQAIYDRFVTLPLVLFQRYGAANMMSGMGLVGGSGALGFDSNICEDPAVYATCVPQYPMAHNALVEFLAMGGLPLLFTFLAAVGVALWRALRMYRLSPHDTDARSLLLVLVLTLTNAPFTSGLISQPYLSGIFFVSLIPVLLIPPKLWRLR